MKKTIEITVSFTGVITTGNYENEKPFFGLKETYELDAPEPAFFIKDRQNELIDQCRKQFKHQEYISRVERIKELYRNIRFYDLADGERFPSVTSIIGWDEDFHISQAHLAQYSARGSIIDKQVEIYLRSGEWKEPKNIPEIYPDLVILKKGDLGLTYDDVDFPEFYKNYPFKVIDLQKTHINKEHRYGGRSDIICIIESSNKGKWEKINGVLFDVLTILDIKSGVIDKTKHMKQQTAYAKCEPDVKQIGLIPLTNKTEQGFSKPIIETDLNKYWSLFLKDRESFRERHGV